MYILSNYIPITQEELAKRAPVRPCCDLDEFMDQEPPEIKFSKTVADTILQEHLPILKARKVPVYDDDDNSNSGVSSGEYGGKCSREDGVAGPDALDVRIRLFFRSRFFTLFSAGASAKAAPLSGLSSGEEVLAKDEAKETGSGAESGSDSEEQTRKKEGILTESVQARLELVKHTVMESIQTNGMAAIKDFVKNVEQHRRMSGTTPVAAVSYIYNRLRRDSSADTGSEDDAEGKTGTGGSVSPPISMDVRYSHLESVLETGSRGRCGSDEDASASDGDGAAVSAELHITSHRADDFGTITDSFIRIVPVKLREFVEEVSQSEGPVVQRVRQSIQNLLERRESSEPAAPTIEDMPDDIMLNVMSLLDQPTVLRIRGVCKSWRSLADDASLWHHISSADKGSGKTLPPRALRYALGRHGAAVEEMELALQCLTDDGLAAILSLCQNLRSLSLAKCVRLTPTAMSHLATGGRCLESLSLRGCGTSVNDVSLADLLMGVGPSLKALSLYKCRSISSVGIAAVAQHCPSLSELDVSFCPKVDNKALEQLALGTRSLHKLNLQKCSGITDAGLSQLKSLPLSHINLDDCAAITDLGVEALASGCPGLTNVCLSRCHEVSDRGIIALSDNCRALERVVLHQLIKVSDDGVAALASRCPALSQLDMSCCIALSDSALHAVAQCPSLKVLNVFGCMELSDAGVQSLLSCTSLESINIQYCDSVTDAGASALLGLPGLRWLGVDASVTEECMSSLRKRNNSLVTLDTC